MQLNRAKNASRNILFGIILKVYQILIPFLIRTAMIYFMGMEYLGLNSLFISILQVLNLSELGVGSAMVYSMYKPIAEDDKKTICALLRLYRTYYYVIGWVITVMGIVILPIIPKLISGDVPNELNLYILYLLNLGATVISYWLFAYKSSLLMAHQRNDLISKVTLATTSVQYGIQLLILVFTRNYYLYLIVALATQIATNIITASIATKYYPDYQPNGKLKKNEIRIINLRIRDLFTSKLGAVIVNSTDTIVISAFLGLSALAIYQNYFFILTSIIGIIMVIFTSCTAGIGNSIIVETKDKNFKDLKKFTFAISWITGFCTGCLLCLYQPFMEIWVGKKYELAYMAVICFCLYYYIYEINQLLSMYKDAAGIWHKDRFRPLMTSVANVVMSLIMVQFWGIYGVLLSTVFSTFFVGMPWILHNLFTTLFEKKQLIPYFKKLVYYAIVTILTCSITAFICNRINISGIVGILVKGIICCFLINGIYFVFYHKCEEFNQTLELMQKIIKN